MIFFACTLILLIVVAILHLIIMKVENSFTVFNLRIAAIILALILANIVLIIFGFESYKNSKNLKIPTPQETIILPPTPIPQETIVLPPTPTPSPTLTPNSDDVNAQIIRSCIMAYLTKENDSILNAKFEEATEGWILAKIFDEEDKPIVIQFCDKNHNIITDEKEIIDKCCKVIQTYYMEIWNKRIPDKIKADLQLYTVIVFLLNTKVDD